jgi:hypothetical protein
MRGGKMDRMPWRVKLTVMRLKGCHSGEVEGRGPSRCALGGRERGRRGAPTRAAVAHHQ